MSFFLQGRGPFSIGTLASQVPPHALVDNMFNFVASQHISALQNIVAEFKVECVQLQRELVKCKTAKAKKDSLCQHTQTHSTF